MLSFYFRPEDVFEKYEVGWGFKMAFSVLKVKPSILLCLKTNLNPLSLVGLVVPIIIILQQYNPLGVMRLSGPWGPGLATSRRWKCQIYVSHLFLQGVFHLNIPIFFISNSKRNFNQSKNSMDSSWLFYNTYLQAWSCTKVHSPTRRRR